MVLVVILVEGVMMVRATVVVKGLVAIVVVMVERSGAAEDWNGCDCFDDGGSGGVTLK